MTMVSGDRQSLDIVIQAILEGRIEEALRHCLTLGLCNDCTDTEGLYNHCLPTRLLEASLTTHREKASEAHAKLKHYLEARHDEHLSAEQTI